MSEIKNRHKEEAQNEIIQEQYIRNEVKSDSIELTLISYIIFNKDYQLLLRLKNKWFLKLRECFDYLIEYYDRTNKILTQELFVGQFNMPLLDVTDVAIDYVINELTSAYYLNQLSIIYERSEQCSNLIEQRDFIQTNIEKIEIDSFLNIKSIGEIYDDIILSKSSDKELGDYIPSGFNILDKYIYGYKLTGNDFVVVVGRTGKGKSWFLIKSIIQIYDWFRKNKVQGNVGFISPELVSTEVGERLATLKSGIVQNYFNKNDTDKNKLREQVKNQFIDAKKFIDKEVKDSNVNIFVADIFDFDKELTINKIKQFVYSYKLKALAIDGISYIIDNKSTKYDNLTTRLTNVSNALFNLSKELQIPIIISVQSNRDGAKTSKSKRLPELTDIRDSDGIAFNATVVMSVGFDDDTDDLFVIDVLKNRRGKLPKTELEINWNLGTGVIEEQDDDTSSLRRSIKNQNNNNGDNEDFNNNINIDNEGEIIF